MTMVCDSQFEFVSVNHYSEIQFHEISVLYTRDVLLPILNIYYMFNTLGG